MSIAVDRFIHKLSARRVRDGEFRAKCPAHQGQSDTSLSIKDGGDRALVFCHAGCSLESILAALGMKSVSELFDSARCPDDPEVQRQIRMQRGIQRLNEWCNQRLAFICAQMRQNERNINTFAEAMSMFEDGILADKKREAEVWDQLIACYHFRTDLEIEFEVLSGTDIDQRAALYRKVEQHA